jgi:integrase
MKKQKNKASEYTLNSHDVRAIINATETTRDKVIIELLAFTGCRRSELVLLRIKDINLDLEQINMPTVKQEPKKKNDDPKTKVQREKLAYDYARRIPIINNDLKRDLKTIIAELNATRDIIPSSRLIQSRQAKSLTQTMINIIVANAANRAGVTSPNPERKHVHPHIFRHTFVRYALKAGMNFKVIQELLGHSRIETTFNLYGHPSWEDTKDEVKKMSGYIA